MSPINYFLDAFRVNYANFTGRARRSEYWYFVLFNALVGGVLYFVGILLGGNLDDPENFSMTGFIPYFIYGLAVFIPGLAVTVRRLHDVGKSGWFYLIGLIPLIGWIWLFVLLVTDSQPGVNKWGPNPKGVGNGFSDDEMIRSIGQ